MSTRAIRSIIILMSLSLIGLILFQTYWISNRIEKEGEEFDRDIQQLLSDVAEKVIQREAIVFVSNFDLEEDTVKEKVNHFINTDEDNNIQIIVKNGKVTASQPNNENEEVIIVGADDGETTIIETRTNSMRNKNAGAGPTSTITTTTRTSTRVGKYAVQKFIDKRKMLTKAVDEMAFSYAFETVPLSSRLASIPIDSIIQNRLVNYGMQELKYKFSIYDPKTDSIIRKGGELMEEKNNLEYQVLIDSSDDSKGKLSLEIPSKNGIILKSLWLTLLLSIVLTLILIGTFIYTINSILKQKRISTIKADFINNMTHEFKTPVATISLAVDSILHKDVKDKPEEIEKLGAIIKKENGRMNRQIESLLGIALFDKEKVELKEERIDVHQIIVELKENFEIKTNAQSGDIALLLNADLSIINADRMHFYNAIRNIIDNGIKFSDTSFRLKIETLNDQKNLIIKISDKGIGMNSETQKKVFDRFYRKSHGDIHTTKGFGLGLSYVKEVIEKTNGSISLKSELGEGSTFTITIPTV